MKTIVLAAAAAAVALVAGPALAGEKAAKAAKLVGPQQPIPYAQLDAYLKASAQERTSRDWWTPAVATTAAADASATAAAGDAAKPAKKKKVKTETKR